jgi:hypothetical protein
VVPAWKFQAITAQFVGNFKQLLRSLLEIPSNDCACALVVSWRLLPRLRRAPSAQGACPKGTAQFVVPAWKFVVPAWKFVVPAWRFPRSVEISKKCGDFALFPRNSKQWRCALFQEIPSNDCAVCWKFQAMTSKQ